MLADSHCHLDKLDLDCYGGDLDKALLAAQNNAVSQMLCVAISLSDLPNVLAIAEKWPQVKASVGVHPLENSPTNLKADQLVLLAEHPEVVAIGETGLDYHYGLEHAEIQQDRFRAHIQAARTCNMPVIIHTREAQKDTLAIMQEENIRDVGGVMHCFTESWAMAKSALEHNFYISFSGIISFKNASELRETAKKVPADRLLIETDSPYLAPEPYRGKPNEPKYLPHVAKSMADLRGVSEEEIMRITTENYQRFIGAG